MMPGLEVIEAKVGGDFIQPGREFYFRFVLVKVFPDANECFLDDVFGIIGIV
jgi:hypothetical protein